MRIICQKLYYQTIDNIDQDLWQKCTINIENSEDKSKKYIYFISNILFYQLKYSFYIIC